MTSSAEKSRPGWTVLEMMVVLPLMAILLTAAAVMLTTLVRMQKGLSDDLNQESSRARLAVQFRADAHGATGASCPSAEICDLTLADGRLVHYEIKSGRLHRELRSGDEVVERDSFPLTRARGSFALDASQSLPLVRLQLEAAEEPRKFSPVSRSSVLEGAVGALRSQPGRSAAP